MSGREMVAVAPAAEITPGSTHLFEVEGVELILVRVDGQVRALAGVCTHARTLLGPFELFDGLIECPSHGAVFDPADGRLVEGPSCPALPIYPSRVDEDGMVRVALPEDGAGTAEQAPFGGAGSMEAWFGSGGAQPG